MARQDQAPGGGVRFPGDADRRRRDFPEDQPGTRSRPGRHSLEESVFIDEQGLRDLAGQLAPYIFGSGQIFGDRGATVATTKRKSDHFEPEARTLKDTSGNQATRIAERNKGRIELVIINPAGNATVYIGGGTVKPSGQTQGIPVPGGNTLVLDTTIDDVWGIPGSGAGDVTVNFFESVDFGLAEA